MSTNYYFIVKNELKAKEEQRINDLINLMDEVFISEKIELGKLIKNMKNREIHIGQSAGGCRFLFQKNEYFNCMKTLEFFYSKFKDKISIEDEYGTTVNWDQLLEIVKSKQGETSRIDRTTSDYVSTDPQGYEWCEVKFS